MWNKLTILWNDVTIDWNDLAWNDLTMEQNDRKSVWTRSGTRTLWISQLLTTLVNQKLFFPMRKFNAKYLKIYNANFVIAKVYADFNIMDSE